ARVTFVVAGPVVATDRAVASAAARAPDMAGRRHERRAATPLVGVVGKDTRAGIRITLTADAAGKPLAVHADRAVGPELETFGHREFEFAIAGPWLTGPGRTVPGPAKV